MSREYLDYEKRRLMTSYLLERAASAGKPITVAFTDESRAVIDITMMDGMAARSVALVSKKAYTAALMHKRTADWWAQMKKLGIDSFAMNDPQMTYLPGGAPIFTDEGDLIGAIGVSGWTMEEDQMLADEAVALLKK
ncbi:heme-binding protein [uncultured Oscillibacter sp.]|jgi:glc operon protein GlcG|uniref:heme-binding protein n=1 Tax=uncultured Oscillibacter sp. TaxID=876091 RepID=UPI002608C379|nr:heme-binding protein [uncultured Oscillibacter sp.]